jgi:SNF2 family DNA or RNA helicase
VPSFGESEFGLDNILSRSCLILYLPEFKLETHHTFRHESVYFLSSVIQTSTTEETFCYLQHPYLFEVVQDRTIDPLWGHLVDKFERLNIVDKLLMIVKERGGRVVICTQMNRGIDIIEDFMVMRGRMCCRIDGTITYEDHESAIDAYNAPGSEMFCFLLCTRGGGMGINRTYKPFLSFRL